MQSSDLGEFAESDIVNPTGDLQTRQDVIFHDEILKAVAKTNACRYLISEEADAPTEIGSGSLTLSLDPFDGSKAFRLGIPAGTIFGVFRGTSSAPASGSTLIASGFLLYGQKPELFFAYAGRVWNITTRATDRLASLGSSERFVCANFSNYAGWSPSWRKFLDQTVLFGDPTPFNSRWFGSLVCHCKAVITSGGMFLYPADGRSSYSRGHIRLVYEAMPLAYLIECLGGECTDGQTRILDLAIQDFHERTPIAFGEKDLVIQLRQTLSGL